MVVLWECGGGHGDCYHGRSSAKISANPIERGHDMTHTKVESMISGNGNPVPNQFRIFTDTGVYFQSYSTVIAFKPHTGKTRLDKESWDYSVTTGKYRNLFLRESKKETLDKIKSGEYELVNLNG
jgi:hypothetical protein